MPSDKKKAGKPKGAGRKSSAPARKPTRSIAAAPGMIEQMMRGVMVGSARGVGSRKDQAQDLCYQAMEAGDPAMMGDLLEQALKLDPHCIDASLMLIDLMEDDPEIKIDALRRVIGWAKAELGAKFFTENRGYFWGIFETRPYMRARAALALVLIEADRDKEAITEYEGMLDLNPGDNQGVRYPLLGLYLGMGRLVDVQRLLGEYPDDGAAMVAWGRVLERFLASDLPGAAQALWSARAKNRHAEAYLAARKRLPVAVPSSYSFGGEDEAMICAEEIGEAWRRNPAAVVWLREQV